MEVLNKSIEETMEVLNQSVRENAYELEEGDLPENNTNEQNGEEASEKESCNDKSLDNLYNIDNIETNTKQQNEDQTVNDYQNAENDNLDDAFQVEEVGGDIMMHEDQ